jgi:hypothetical protein
MAGVPMESSRLVPDCAQTLGSAPLETGVSLEENLVRRNNWRKENVMNRAWNGLTREPEGKGSMVREHLS